MIESPLISVIIPVYNVEKYLRQCIDSVLNQTYKKIEILLIDDGSTDTSSQICDEYAELNNNVQVFHKQNGGASSARNYGLKQSNGDYLYFLDSDDYLDESALTKMISCAIENNADLVFIEAQSIDENGKMIMGKYDYHKLYLPNDPVIVMEEMINHKEFHVGTPFFLLRKDLLFENRIYFFEGIIYEDMISAYQFFSLANRCAHVHQYVYTRRFRANSVMTSAKSEKNFTSAVAVYKEVAKFRDTLPVEKQSPKHLIRCAFNVLRIYRQMTPTVRKKYKTDYDEIVKDILANNAYGDEALKLDCKSHMLWAAYKVKKKVFK